MNKKEREHIIKSVRDAGVVGAGGAGFPTYIKLRSHSEYLLINGAECEPLLRVDKTLLEKYTDELVSTAHTLREVVQAKEALFCVKKKEKNIIERLRNHIAQFKHLRVHLLDDVYPAGDEQVMVYEALGRIVPQGGIPLDVGAVVINVETLLNVSRALSHNKPVTHTYLTIGGDVDEPLTVCVPIGSPIKELLPLCGKGFDPSRHIIIEGGPMMGNVVEDWKSPVVKTTKGLLIFNRASQIAEKYTAPRREIDRNIISICSACQECTEICPRYLLGHSIEPHKIMIAVAEGAAPDAMALQEAAHCCECGLCEMYACFMSLSPRQLMARLRKDLAAQGLKPEKSNRVSEPNPLRDSRRIPTRRLKARLGISHFDRDTRFIEQPQLRLRELRIPLKQHTGVPCSPVVKKGEKVHKDQIIADVEEDAMGVPIHSPVDGTISKIHNRIITIRT